PSVTEPLHRVAGTRQPNRDAAIVAGAPGAYDSPNVLVWKMKVLIADDSEIVRERLAYLLGDVEGLEIVGQAEDAVEAEDLAEALKPDVAILDVRMPRGSGVDVLRAIKRDHPSAVVIMLTNFVDPEARALCLEQGADYFFDKSIEFDQAVAVLRDL